MKSSVVILSALMLLSLSSCGGSGGYAPAAPDGDTLTAHAQLLTLIDVGEYAIAEIKNPWDTTKLLGRYALVPRDSGDIAVPECYVKVPVPLHSSLVYSSVHAGAIKELGAVNAITGVADASYFKIPEVADGIKSGRVTDVGSSMSPTAELIAELSPEAMLVSPFENAGHGIIEKLGIPIIECADYMESTPAGRAEWIKLLGILYGNRAAADSIFESSMAEYDRLALLAAAVKNRPKVICEQAIDGVWYMPGGESYMAQLIHDAGADYPWADTNSAGSLQLDLPQVLDKAQDADFWIMRVYGYPVTLAQLKRDNPINARFKAYAAGNVYYCDTSQSMLFEDFPFHPDRLLREFIFLFNPGLIGGAPSYYKRAEAK